MKIIGSVLIFFLTILWSSFVFSFDPFPDVSPHHWARFYISWGKNRGIFTGGTDGSFRPEDLAHREHVVASIIRAKYGEYFSYNPTPYFYDVPPWHWSFKYVQKAYEDGITRGCGSGYFCPTDLVTREQVVTFIVRAKFGENFTYSQRYIPDIPSTHWSYKYVNKALDHGYTYFYPDGTFKPYNYITRSELSVYLYKAFY